MRSVGEHFCRNDSSNILFYNPKFAPAFERIFCEPFRTTTVFLFLSPISFFFFLERKGKKWAFTKEIVTLIEKL